jgi:hypothetical protein
LPSDPNKKAAEVFSGFSGDKRKISDVFDAIAVVALHFAALDADVLFQLALGCVEGIAQRNVDIFVGLFVVVFAADHDVLVGYADINANVIEITLVLVVVIGFYGDLAADDVVTKVFELRCLFPNSGFHGVGVRNAAEGNL